MKIYDESRRLYRYFNHTMDNRGEETIIDLFTFVENYLNLATLQIKRLRSAEETLSEVNGRITKPEHKELIRLYFGDVHFFFNCAHKFLVLASRLSKKIGYSNPNLDFLKNHYATIRNHFEHIDERIERHPYFRKDLSCISGDELIVEGKAYSISTDSLTPLYEIFDGIISRMNEIIARRKKEIDQAWQPFDEKLLNGVNHHERTNPEQDTG